MLIQTRIQCWHLYMFMYSKGTTQKQQRWNCCPILWTLSVCFQEQKLDAFCSSNQRTHSKISSFWENCPTWVFGVQKPALKRHHRWPVAVHRRPCWTLWARTRRLGGISRRPLGHWRTGLSKTWSRTRASSTKPLLLAEVNFPFDDPLQVQPGCTSLRFAGESKRRFCNQIGSGLPWGVVSWSWGKDKQMFARFTHGEPCFWQHDAVYNDVLQVCMWHNRKFMDSRRAFILPSSVTPPSLPDLRYRMRTWKKATHSREDNFKQQNDLFDPLELMTCLLCRPSGRSRPSIDWRSVRVNRFPGDSGSLGHARLSAVSLWSAARSTQNLQEPLQGSNSGKSDGGWRSVRRCLLHWWVLHILNAFYLDSLHQLLMGPKRKV